MGLHDKDYWKNKQKNNQSIKNVSHSLKIKPDKKPIHPLYWVLLTLVIIWFGMEKWLISRPLLPDNAIIVDSKSIPGGLVVYADPSGHYRGTLQINGVNAPFMIDTGATMIAIPESVANRAGLKKGQAMIIKTAGGDIVDYASSVKTFTFGNALLYDVPVAINQHIEEILIGVNLLKLFKIQHNPDSMILTLNRHNKLDDTQAFDPHSKSFHDVKAVVDSGDAPKRSDFNAKPQPPAPKTNVQSSWTKTVVCDNKGNCKTSYH